MKRKRPQDLTGQVVNNFEIQDVIGQGGMGTVYRAYHPDLEKYAAVKIMLPDLASQEGFYERFLMEARTAARLEHPNIVDVINFGRFGDSYYLMMDYIEGPSLRELIQENKSGLPLWDVAQVFWQISDVLVYSHAAGVLHRDLKPDNILLTHSVRPNRPYRAIVTDFGLVKLAQNSIFETQEGISVGTPAYMSPEQCRGHDVDGRTDIYALGVMLYEAVTGQRPYPIRNLFDAVKFHSSGKLVTPRVLNEAISPELEQLIQHMLEPDLDKRLATAAEATDVLQELIVDLSADGTGKMPSTVVQMRVTGVVSEPPVVPDPEEAPSTPTVTPAAGTGDRFFIRVSYQGVLQDRAYPLGPKALRVGRLGTSDIVLDRPERYVSKQHCEVMLLEGRVLLRDLGSTNGTYLGADKIQPNVYHEWDMGVDVNLGPFTLSLASGEELDQVPSPPVDVSSHAPTTKIQFAMRVCCPNAVPSRLPLLAERAIVIGRAVDCDMVVNNALVSKYHCRIQLGEAGAEIVDLRSTNGTYFRNQRLPPHTPVPWKEDPTIAVGPFTVTLEDKTAEEEEKGGS